MIKREWDTHLVLKWEDIGKYLPQEKQEVLEGLCDQIMRGRILDYKSPRNEYLVCNQDEPYANSVLYMILQGEEDKQLDRTTTTTRFTLDEREAMENLVVEVKCTTTNTCDGCVREKDCNSNSYKDMNVKSIEVVEKMLERENKGFGVCPMCNRENETKKKKVGYVKRFMNFVLRGDTSGYKSEYPSVSKEEREESKRIIDKIIEGALQEKKETDKFFMRLEEEEKLNSLERQVRRARETEAIRREINRKIQGEETKKDE